MATIVPYQPTNTVTAALACSSDVLVLVAGHSCEAVAKAAAQIQGVKKVIHVESEAFAHGLAEQMASQVLALAPGCSHILFAATASGKNIAPRVAALLDVAQISDITKVENADTFERPIYAGNAIATVKSSDAIKAITVRATAFDAAAKGSNKAEIAKIDAKADAAGSEFIGASASASERPELTQAKIIISGGRALGSSEKFQEVILPVADKLGADALFIQPVFQLAAQDIIATGQQQGRALQAVREACAITCA